MPTLTFFTGSRPFVGSMFVFLFSPYPLLREGRGVREATGPQAPRLTAELSAGIRTAPHSAGPLSRFPPGHFIRVSGTLYRSLYVR